MKTDDILKNLKEHLDSLTPEEFQEEWESITHENLYNRWVEKVHNLPSDKLLNLIEKVKLKYESDKYIDSEYDKGYEPRTPLYFTLYDYASEYEKDIYEETAKPWNSMFTDGRYLIQGKYIIELLIGQGSVVRLFTLDEWEEHDKYLKKRYEERQEKYKGYI